MDQKEPDMAAAFVDELLGLKIVKLMEEGMEVLVNVSLLTVPKEGQQEGQWRVITGMLQGDHHSCSGHNPCAANTESYP
jgi:hypothetical protein